MVIYLIYHQQNKVDSTQKKSGETGIWRGNGPNMKSVHLVLTLTKTAFFLYHHSALES